MKTDSHESLERGVDQAVTDVLAGDLQEDMDDLAKRRLFDQVIGSASLEESFRPSKRRQGRLNRHVLWVGGAAAMGIAAAAVLVLVMYTPALLRSSDSEPIATGISKTQEAKTADVNGANIQHTERVSKEPKEPVRMGEDGAVEAATRRIAVKLPSGIDLLLEPNTKIRHTRVAGDAITIDLLRGRVLASVDPHRSGPPFSIVTEKGSAEVKGTIFVVEASADSTSVMVIRGNVETRSASGLIQPVEAGYALILGDTALKEIPAQTTRILSSDVMILTDLTRNENSVVDLSETFSAAIGQAGNGRPLSADRMLKRARALCIEKKWKEAVVAYQSLIREYPSGEESSAALISLGDLQLNQLNSPQAALNSYNRYLSSGKQILRQEALTGKAAALHALHNESLERQTLQAFLDRFPNALQATEVRRRIDALKK